MIKEKIYKVIQDTVGDNSFVVEHPADMSHGDYSSNVAMVIAQQEGKNSKEVATELAKKLEGKIPEVGNIEIAGPGFINFYLSDDFLTKTTLEIAQNPDYGKNTTLSGKKILVEHTSPNAFKPLHIGHFMANAIGESISRLFEYCGAEVTRATYASDIGLPVAKAVWGMKQLQEEMPSENDSLERKIEFIGNSYVHGATHYDQNESIKTEIDQINVALYKKTDEELVNLYNMGRAWSLEYLRSMYQKLDTKFDYEFFESEVFDEGLRLVREHQEKVFEESEGAVVFRGEDHGLHTRVFVTSKGAPTYEAKELGLHIKKSAIPFDESIVVTGNEQKGVMEVGLKAFEQIDPDTAKKVGHIAHGLMLGADGKKMSSRIGGALSASELILEVQEKVKEKMADRDISNIEKISEQIAIGALRFQILKQGSGKNIVFDLEQATNFEGDSGPYLQYALRRAESVLQKAQKEGIKEGQKGLRVYGPEHLLGRFEDLIIRAQKEFTPQTVTQYLVELAGAFNSFYAKEKIIDPENSEDSYKISLTKAIRNTLKAGLYLLSIPVPEEM